MSARPRKPVELGLPEARRLWLRAQRLDGTATFGTGAEAVRAAVEHLGYVQIDTIAVIERSHHHILWARIPTYRSSDLHDAQTVEKSVFEYWTHALAYVPTADWRFFAPAMRRHRQAPRQWFGTVTRAEKRGIVARIRTEGALTIRDIADDVLVDKVHAWASRKPSKRALQQAFYDGELTVSARAGMLKTYELTERHFGWNKPPAPATERQVTAYHLDRALRAQSVISLDSVCYLDAPRKPLVREAIEARVRSRRLVPVTLAGAGKIEHWAEPAALDAAPVEASGIVHILSPFDPLIIQRRRLHKIFGYAHRFEAYVPRDKRVLGYFALPVLIGDRVVAALDLKTDRTARVLKVQSWTWLEDAQSPAHRAAIEEALHRFEAFQLAGSEGEPDLQQSLTMIDDTLVD